MSFSLLQLMADDEYSSEQITKLISKNIKLSTRLYVYSYLYNSTMHEMIKLIEVDHESLGHSVVDHENELVKMIDSNYSTFKYNHSPKHTLLLWIRYLKSDPPRKLREHLDYELQDEYGYTALMLYIEFVGRIPSAIWSNLVNPNITTYDSKLCSLTIWLLKLKTKPRQELYVGINPNLIDAEGRTPFEYWIYILKSIPPKQLYEDLDVNYCGNPESKTPIMIWVKVLKIQPPKALLKYYDTAIVSKNNKTAAIYWMKYLPDIPIPEQLFEFLDADAKYAHKYTHSMYCVRYCKIAPPKYMIGINIEEIMILWFEHVGEDFPYEDFGIPRPEIVCEICYIHEVKSKCSVCKNPICDRCYATIVVRDEINKCPFCNATPFRTIPLE